MSEVEQLLSLVKDLHRKVDSLTAAPKPHLSRTEFAQAVKKHPNTVTRWINRGRVRTEKGRIPRTELAKFVS